ncbi:hypothetical protein AGMMS4952_22040 [Spirochaetia bacterium]|nr:hypothetical protein AGMMS4952_22040 [Spirochaetia bacterium]
MLATDYDEEFCLALEFDPAFIASLMKAGFLVMSAAFDEDEEEDPVGLEYILLPKLHLERSVLLFPELHTKKSLRHHLSRYELRVDGIPASDLGPPDLTDIESLAALGPGATSDFDYIMDRCVAVHDDAWLTAPLCAVLREIRALPWMPNSPARSIPSRYTPKERGRTGSQGRARISRRTAHRGAVSQASS